MIDHAKELRARAELLRAWHKFELGMPPPPAFDYLATADLLQRAATIIEQFHSEYGAAVPGADKAAATK